ncbi:hypothetical protein AUJ46_01350 [Candidatus Peregrinibacteria bacterium CG1_02_54_53]|nr:MAG: hypothetical protein AUJ46_01350 [Candidatus Peregrinibacteria bacterium CG1_02_54_53]
MPANTILLLPLFALIGILKFSEDRFCLACLRHGRLLVSAVVGVASVSVFTQLLNDTYTAVHTSHPLTLVGLPAGFVATILLARHIHAHEDAQGQSELLLLLRSNAIASGVLIGIVAALMSGTDALRNIIFIIGLVAYDLLDDLSMHAFHRELSVGTARTWIARLLAVLSPFIGWMLASFLPFSSDAHAVLLSLFAGVYLAILVREILPQDRALAVPWFLAGSGVVTGLFILQVVLS